MNADKLADALREKIAKWRGMKKGELYLAAQICADELERLLAEYDAQPAQAAQPVLYAISTSMRSWWTYDKDEADAARFDGANVQEIREQAAQPVGVPDVAITQAGNELADLLLRGQTVTHKRPFAGYGEWILNRAKDVAAAPQPPAQPSADAEE